MKNDLKVQILLSSYNGEHYIRTQLDSLLNQNYPNFSILIRDDGSTDKTIQILQEYAEKDSRICYYLGKNIGVQKSFFDLLLHADPQCNYFAFSDQDDSWLPEKISRAVAILEKSSNNQMALYCSDKLIVDQNLQPIHVTVSRKVHKISFGNALVQNICTGCTAVINNSLWQYMCQHTPLHIEKILMHDWWFYLTASCFGYVYYDKIPYLYYRQHNNNTSGAMLSQQNLLKYRLRQLTKPRGEIYHQIKEFYTTFNNEISPSNKKLIHTILKAEHSFLGKINLILERDIFRQKITDNLVLKLIILLGKL